MLSCQRSPNILVQADSNLFLWHYTVPLYHFFLASALSLFCLSYLISCFHVVSESQHFTVALIVYRKCSKYSEKGSFF